MAVGVVVRFYHRIVNSPHERRESTVFIFIWIVKISAWLIAHIGVGLLVDNLLFGPPKKKKKQGDHVQPTAKRHTTS